jgi:flagellar biosynthesis protein FlhF
MEVVSTPREMRAAVARLANLDLILMDTAGRSPRDEVRIQELRSMLGEAQADEVQLVLSSVASPASMKKAAERFSQVGAMSLILTKLDEATGMGNLLPLLRNCRLPLSYVTNGQNVPDDIAAADRRQLARAVLGMEASL